MGMEANILPPRSVRPVTSRLRQSHSLGTYLNAKFAQGNTRPLRVPLLCYADYSNAVRIGKALSSAAL